MQQLLDILLEIDDIGCRPEFVRFGEYTQITEYRHHFVNGISGELRVRIGLDYRDNAIWVEQLKRDWSKNSTWDCIFFGMLDEFGNFVDEE